MDQMTAVPSSQPPGLPATAEIDSSCRVPLLVLMISSALWLLIGSVFAMIGTIKFHGPNFLADSEWLTYGRVRPAYINAVLYGFCLQAGLAVTLWMIARLGRITLAYPLAVTIGAALLNFGVTAGVFGILSGDATGFEHFEFPRYGVVAIFLGYILISIPGLVTFHQRRERSVFVSQWFVVAALFWFPWIYSTAELLLLQFPVRGVTQAIIAWWFSNNFLLVWLSLVGLGAIFYFLPKLAATELDSRYLALLTFWFLIFFGSWCGIPVSAPVPAWLPALSTVATVLMLLTALTFALILYGTLKNKLGNIRASLPLQFIVLGAGGFLLTILINICSALPPLSDITAFTWFTSARVHTCFYGFFSLTMFGAIYYILPRVVGVEFPFIKLVRAHLWLAGVGIVLVILPLAVGGVIQGVKLANPAIAFNDVTKASIHFLRVSTIGDLFIAAGHLFFLLNGIALLSRFLRPRAIASYEAATAELFKSAEAKL